MFNIERLPPSDLSLSDKVIYFIIQGDTYVILLDDALLFNVVHIKKDKTYTLCVCSHSYACCVVQQSMELSKETKNSLTAFIGEDNETYTIPELCDKNNNVILVNIALLRQALATTLNIYYLVPMTTRPKAKFEKEPNIRTTSGSTSYKTARELNRVPHSYHDETLVRVVAYRSAKTLDIKHSILIGCDANKKTITGYNTKISNIDMYINKHERQFVQKNALIIPMLWKYAINIYKDAKYVSL